MALRLFIAGLKIMLGFLESRLLNLIDVIVSKKLAVVRFLDSGSLPLHLQKFPLVVPTLLRAVPFVRRRSDGIIKGA